MKLDSRITEGPLDCFDTEIAEQYIGKTVYCTNIASYLIDLKHCKKGKFLSIDEDNEYAYEVRVGEFVGLYLYIIPEEWVKEEK